MLLMAVWHSKQKGSHMHDILTLYYMSLTEIICLIYLVEFWDVLCSKENNEGHDIPDWWDRQEYWYQIWLQSQFCLKTEEASQIPGMEACHSRVTRHCLSQVRWAFAESYLLFMLQCTFSNSSTITDLCSWVYFRVVMYDHNSTR